MTDSRDFKKGLNDMRNTSNFETIYAEVSKEILEKEEWSEEEVNAMGLISEGEDPERVRELQPLSKESQIKLVEVYFLIILITLMRSKLRPFNLPQEEVSSWPEDYPLTEFISDLNKYKENLKSTDMGRKILKAAADYSFLYQSTVQKLPQMPIYNPAQVQEPQPQAQVQEPQRAAQVQEPQRAAQAQEPQPQAQAQEPQPQAQVQEPQPQAQVQEPQPQAQVQEPQPQAQVQEPQPQAQVQEPQRAAQAQEPQPGAQVQEPQPQRSSHRSQSHERRSESRASTIFEKLSNFLITTNNFMDRSASFISGLEEAYTGKINLNKNSIFKQSEAGEAGYVLGLFVGGICEFGGNLLAPLMK